jgi:23S rRNA (uracil1939-C5)-methyltransferase
MTRNKIKAPKHAKKAPVVKNQEIIGEVVDITFQGLGVVKVDNYPIFVVDAIPGEQVKVGVTRVLQNYAFGRMIERLVTSPNRVSVEHNQLITSGIAPLVNLKYEAQLELKQQQVKQLFKKVGLDVEVDPTIGMEKPYHYRNKTVVPVKYQDGKLVTGFYRRGSHNLVPIDDYYLNDPKIDQAIGTVRDILNAHGTTVWDDATKQGEIRYIMVRRGYYTHEMMVGLITATRELTNEAAIIEDIVAALPELKSLILNYNPRQTNVLLGTENRVLYGQSTIQDTILDNKFNIGLNSFYQVNPQTTEVLYSLAAQKAGLKPTDTVIDAYSGIGTIGLTVANQVQQVIGVEVVEPAVADAQVNMALNNIDNAVFIANDAPEQMRQWQAEGLQPEVVFVDPPRKGLTPELIEAVAGMAPETFVYISCNPATLARDAVQIIEQGFEIDGPVTPLDQFPQTTHVESIVVFKRKVL